ncbi:MAG: lytic murein transglycosylase [Candidatus Pacebacteria bacterium]|nr:lytic murein transglycosylase [Candidatus Paceibacterota bacterium]
MRHSVQTVFMAVALSIPLTLHATEETLRTEAVVILSKHIDVTYVSAQLHDKDVCGAYVLPPQKYLLLAELRTQMLAEDSLAVGEWFFWQYASVLDKLAAGDKFLPYYTIAVLRIESDFGKNLGTEPALRTFYSDYVARRTKKGVSQSQKPLVTQAVPLLRYAQTLGIDPCTIYGSHSGAIGLPQFMPFNLHLTRDGDDDGIIDIVRSPYDAMASIVSFFKDRRWGKRPRTDVLRRYCGTGRYAERYAAIAEEYALAVKKRVEKGHH